MTPHPKGRRHGGSRTTGGPADERQVSVSDGIVLLGGVRGTPGKYVALDAHRRSLGRFKTARVFCMPTSFPAPVENQPEDVT
jgi:hypothetical protein